MLFWISLAGVVLEAGVVGVVLGGEVLLGAEATGDSGWVEDEGVEASGAVAVGV